MPCAANALLNEEGLPVVCETDIHGAVTALMAEAAGMGEKRTFFADWTIRHPDIAERRASPALRSVAYLGGEGKADARLSPCVRLSRSLTAEAKHGEITLCRFDGDNGEYSLLLGNAKGMDGPYTKGTYLWIEVENLKRLEEQNRLRAVYPPLRRHP